MEVSGDACSLDDPEGVAGPVGGPAFAVGGGTAASAGICSGIPRGPDPAENSLRPVAPYLLVVSPEKARRARGRQTAAFAARHNGRFAAGGFRPSVTPWICISAAAEEEETPQIPAGAIGRMERVLTLLEDDPQALLHCAWEHMRWLDRHSFFKVRVRHLNVFWTVTCEDASRTAIAYGAALSALNAALAAAQQMLHLQSDRLCLEPDFTGQRRQEREISFTVSACAALMFHLLYRIWKDPLLQPAPRESTV